MREIMSRLLAQAGLTRCGDNSCMFGSPGGMATNGGCRCIENFSDRRLSRSQSLYIQRLPLALRNAVADIEQLKRELALRGGR